MKKKLLYLFVATVLSSALFAQQIKVKGIVMTLKGKPLTATILVKSSKEKMITDEKGLFTIKCNSKDKIKISVKDYSTKTIKIKGDKFLVIKMKKSGIDYAQYLSFTEIMISMYSGIVIMEPSEIYVINRKTGEREKPLLKLDDEDVDINTLIRLPTSYIKSIKVLRELETVIYGERGSNGVIVVTTNKK